MKRSGTPASAARTTREEAVVHVFPDRRATVPPGGWRARGGGLPISAPIVSPFGELLALSVRREELEEEILALWEG